MKDSQDGLLHFETFTTLCPIDLSAVNMEYLDCEVKKWLDQYHEMVYAKIEAFLPEEEREWRKNVTSPNQD